MGGNEAEEQAKEKLIELSQNQRKKIVKGLIFAIVITFSTTIILTAYATYRLTMNNIQVQLDGDKVNLTVFGITDTYE